MFVVKVIVVYKSKVSRGYKIYEPHITYLPLSNAGSTTKVSHKVRTGRDIGKIKGKSLIRFLVNDDKSKLVVVASSKDTPSIRVRIIKFDLSGLVSEVGTISDGRKSLRIALNQKIEYHTLDKASKPNQQELFLQELPSM